ncbi:MAG: hypothetical protein M3Q29_08975 [Chloroflexota bacterium]|nr:hypothetical protein [Chloroflexota bacterium]
MGTARAAVESLGTLGALNNIAAPFGRNGVFGSNITSTLGPSGVRGLSDYSAFGRPSEALQDAVRNLTAASNTNLASTLGRVAAMDSPHLDRLTGRIASSALLSAGSQLNAIASIANPLKEMRSQIADYVARPLLKLDWSSLFPKTWDWFEDFARSRRIEEAFSCADLVPSPSMSHELVERVLEAYEAGAGRVEITEMVMSECDADGCRLLGEIVDKLRVNPYLAGREETLRQTLEIHRLGFDAVSSYPLVPMIEGVMVPFLQELTDKKVGHNRIAGELGEMPVQVGYAVGIEGLSCAIAFMESRLYKSFDWTSDAIARSNYIDLNRHLLLHGMAVQGTRENTARCFLLLDLVGALLPAVDRMLDEEAATQS